LELFLERDGYVLELIAEPNCVDQHPIFEKMDIGWNAQIMGEVRFDSCEEKLIRIDLPRNLIRKTANDLMFQFEGIHEEQLATRSAEMPEALVKIKRISFLLQ
jgi:hypothetical protein